MTDPASSESAGEPAALGPGNVPVAPGVILEHPPRVLAPIAHCEGVARGPDGMLFAADEAGRLFRIDPADGSFAVVADVGGWGLGLAVDGDGLVYACVFDQHRVVRADPATGEVVDYCTTVEGGTLPEPNWCSFGEDGTLYVTDSRADGKRAKEGRVVAVPPGGGDARELTTDRLYYANGMAVRTDGRLFIVDTFVEPRIVTLQGDRYETFVDLPGTVPDGLALDEEGGLWISCFQPNRLLHVPRDGGAPRIVIDDWTGQVLLSPTNVCFFGPGNRSLACASLLGWWLSAIDTPVAGQELFYPTLAR